MIDRKPYTYLIGWSKLNVWYYGVRYGKRCKPADLWNPYKTSSKQVKLFSIENGEPDIIQVRKIFDDIDQARLWEHKVLRRIKASKRYDFLNKTDNISIYNNEQDRKLIGEKISKSTKGYLKTTQHCKNISLGKRGKIPNISKENRAKIVEASHSKEANIKRSNKMSSKIWITNGKENKRIVKDDPLPQDWKLGRYLQQTQKRKDYLLSDKHKQSSLSKGEMTAYDTKLNKFVRIKSKIYSENKERYYSNNNKNIPRL